MDSARVNPRGCENDLCINLNNCFLWEKVVFGKRNEGCFRSWILQRILEGEDLRPVAGGETCDLAVLPRKHLEDPERCLASLMATRQCKLSCVWAPGMSIAAEENQLRPLLYSTMGFIYAERWETSLGMVGARCRALAGWLHSPFKGFTSVPPAALLLIILLSPASTDFTEESSRRDISFLLFSVKMGFFVFLCLECTRLWDTSQLSCVPALSDPFFSLPFWWLVLFVWILSKVFFNYVFITF